MGTNILMKIKRRLILVTISCLLLLYVGSYTALYANRCPAANMMYFAYLKGGTETEGEEDVLYRFYYPVYKLHYLLGGQKHNYDRPKPPGVD